MATLLELSVTTQNILTDMSLYADLGMQECKVNEVVQHHYGVMGDGQFHVGLHATNFDSPTLTYILPNVARYASALEQLNIEFEQADLSDEHFNQISFFDPADQRINLIEARTFSPLQRDLSRPQWLGEFRHVELPATPGRDAFWQQLAQAVNAGIEQSNLDQDDSSQSDSDQLKENGLIRLDTHCERLSVVYEGDLEALIIHSAQQGWQHFTVTDDAQGVYRTPHHFDLIVNQAAQ